MNKELEAFRNGFYMREENNGEVIYRYRFTNEDIDLIEKALKALEIVKEKEVNVQHFKSCLEVGWDYETCEKYCQDNDEWEEYPPYRHSMKKEEFELLKEVLL